jgi:hypothetical protein
MEKVLVYSCAGLSQIIKLTSHYQEFMSRIRMLEASSLIHAVFVTSWGLSWYTATEYVSTTVRIRGTVSQYWPGRSMKVHAQNKRRASSRLLEIWVFKLVNSSMKYFHLKTSSFTTNPIYIHPPRNASAHAPEFPAVLLGYVSLGSLLLLKIRWAKWKWPSGQLHIIAKTDIHQC